MADAAFIFTLFDEQLEFLGAHSFFLFVVGVFFPCSVTGSDQSHCGSFATFERHSNGVASKLMAKMGFVEGSGLGKQKQGISEPIQVAMRPKNRGLGAT